MPKIAKLALFICAVDLTCLRLHSAHSPRMPRTWPTNQAKPAEPDTHAQFERNYREEHYPTPP